MKTLTTILSIFFGIYNDDIINSNLVLVDSKNKKKKRILSKESSKYVLEEISNSTSDILYRR